jgi:hypothetical protein
MSANNVVPFAAGYIVTVVKLMFTWTDINTLLSIDIYHFVLVYGQKILSTLFFGLFGGAMGMLGKDLYRIIKRSVVNFAERCRQKRLKK